jgi:hypothetical protein
MQRSTLRMLVLSLMLLLVFQSAFAQDAAPDADGDGIPDSQDFCWRDPGTADFHGCTADNFPDFDLDGVGDPVDTCVDQAGVADNSGCPIGVTPDLDLDGVPDAADACPREAGTPNDNGCPPDADGDGIPDAGDACREQPGQGENLGCPDGVRPLDSDGDSLPDLLDACPQQSGSLDFGGCPDRDGDGVPDSLDTCPDELGQSELFGCAPVTMTPLPTATASISAGNAATVRELAHLVVGLPRFGVSSGNLLAVRASDDLLIYDLSASQLAPIASAGTGWSGYPVAVSGDGRFIATLEFPPDFSTPPFVQTREGASGMPLNMIASQPGSDGTQLAIANFAFNPVLPLLALAETTGGGVGNGAPTSVILWDVANNRAAGQLAHPNVVVNLAFSGDGTKLATDSAEGDSMKVSLWDMGTQALIASFPTTPILHFIGTPLALNTDGSMAAVGYPDGSLHRWNIAGTTATEQYAVPLFDSASSEIVSAVALSPDGSVIAVAGGVPFSGGLTGAEQFPIYLIDAATGTTLARLQGHGSLIRDLAFSRDGRYLISAGDSSVRFWGM